MKRQGKRDSSGLHAWPIKAAVDHAACTQALWKSVIHAGPTESFALRLSLLSRTINSLGGKAHCALYPISQNVPECCLWNGYMHCSLETVMQCCLWNSYMHCCLWNSYVVLPLKLSSDAAFETISVAFGTVPVLHLEKTKNRKEKKEKRRRKKPKTQSCRLKQFQCRL